MNPALVKELLSKGDKLAIRDGRLLIVPANQEPVSDDWLRKNKRSITLAILDRLGLDAFTYLSFSTGLSWNKYSGIYLQFQSMVARASAYAAFNAEIRYVRGDNKGKPYPNKRFRVTERHEFVNFWLRCGLESPPSHTQYHDYMGKLKSIIFTAEYSKGEKFSNKTLRPLTVDHDTVQTLFSSSSPAPTPYNIQTNSLQTPNKYHTSNPYKEIAQSQKPPAIHANTATGVNNHGISNQGEAGIPVGPPTYPSTMAATQTTAKPSQDLVDKIMKVHQINKIDPNLIAGHEKEFAQWLRIDNQDIDDALELLSNLDGAKN